MAKAQTRPAQAAPAQAHNPQAPAQRTVVNAASSSGLWPPASEAASLTTIVQDQATTIAAQAALIDGYQDALNTAQTPPPAAATGTGTGTSLVVAGVVGVIIDGAVVTGSGVPTSPPTTIVAQTAGAPGGDGTYTTSAATTITSGALTFTPGGGPMQWPSATDSPTLLSIQQAQSALLRNQTAVIQQYIDLLNASETAPT
jgi:hypothetical protein